MAILLNRHDFMWKTKMNDMSKNKIVKDFTKGSIPKQMFMFMLPFMISNALQVLYSTVDMVIVGKYVGTAGISAVSQSSLILNLATMVCLGFSNAGQILVSQALGAGKKREVNESLIREFNCPMEILAKIIEDKVIDLSLKTKFDDLRKNI